MLLHLELLNFRNIQTLQVSPHPRFNFFYGENAQGKTSILEAIYFLSELRSFRILDLAPLVLHGQPAASLSAEIGADQEIKTNRVPYPPKISTHDLKIQIQPLGKRAFLDGKAIRPFKRLRRLIPSVLFTPDSVRLFRSSPGTRRNYFDHFLGLFSDAFANHTLEYSRVLRQKQELLEWIKKNPSQGPLLFQEMEVWNEKLAELGASIIAERFQGTQGLNASLSPSFEALSQGEWRAALFYQPYLRDLKEEMSISQIRDTLQQEIERRKNDELKRGQILVGPHRDDWSFLLGGSSLKEEGSQGQHRIAVASLKLAEVAMILKKGLIPVALFDDLLSELDSSRASRVLEVLSASPCQVFLTSTTPLGISLQGLGGKTFQVRNGNLL